LGLLAVGQWKIVIGIILERKSYTIFFTNFAQVLTTKVASRDMTRRSRGQRSRSQGHLKYSVKIQ